MCIIIINVYVLYVWNINNNINNINNNVLLMKY